jgi:hypothetical protein
MFVHFAKSSSFSPSLNLQVSKTQGAFLGHEKRRNKMIETNSFYIS